MDQTIVTFGDIEIEKMSFTFKNVLPFQTCINIYISNIYISNIYFFYSGEKKKNYKYFIGYLYDVYNVKPLYIMLLETSAYVKTYDGQTKWMYFLIEDDYL